MHKATGLEIGILATGFVKCSAEIDKGHESHHHGMTVSSLSAPPGHRMLLYSYSSGGGGLRDTAEQPCAIAGLQPDVGIPPNVRSLRAAKANLGFVAHMVGRVRCCTSCSLLQGSRTQPAHTRSLT